MTAPKLRILSLGAGVQSSTLALMIARGDLPMVDCAIFADTGAEPQGTYDYLDWLETQLPYPVHRVSIGNLRDAILSGDKAASWGRPPFFVAGKTKTGMLNRQCTQDYKIRVIQRKVRELIGLKPGQRGPKKPVVQTLIGISMDEAIRMKPSRTAYIENVWPLIELGMHRHQCIKWLEERQYRIPPKSACTFCPYRSDIAWRDMRDNDPASWADAVAVDAKIRDNMPGVANGQVYIHRSLKPLDQVDLSTAEDRGQMNLFLNECEGMCGV
jgi:hypothetical protein